MRYRVSECLLNVTMETTHVKFIWLTSQQDADYRKWAGLTIIVGGIISNHSAALLRPSIRFMLPDCSTRKTSRIDDGN